MSLINAQNSKSVTSNNIKVMIIDDSAIIRGLISRWIEAENDLDFVGYGINGLDGIERAKKLQPDIIILDIEMPQMDGISALPILLKELPGVKIIMASTLTKAGAEVTIKALTLGATDYIAKPDAGRIAGAEDYKRDLFAKLRAFGRRRSKLDARVQPQSNLSDNGNRASFKIGQSASSEISIKPFNNKIKAEALFIGSSTGGPEALRVVVQGLVGKTKLPVIITQHMPPMFTKILAEHLSKQTGAKVIEGENDALVEPSTFYIAPGGKHMVIVKTPAGVRIKLNEDPPENFCRPAVDPLFRSAAQVYGDKLIATILTGMGHDGREGAKILSTRGAYILAQDEATSVVWGMPGAVAAAGIANAIKPVDQIAPTILNLLRGVAP